MRTKHIYQIIREFDRNYGHKNTSLSCFLSQGCIYFKAGYERTGASVMFRVRAGRLGQEDAVPGEDAYRFFLSTDSIYTTPWLTPDETEQTRIWFAIRKMTWTLAGYEVEVTDNKLLRKLYRKNRETLLSCLEDVKRSDAFSVQNGAFDQSVTRSRLALEELPFLLAMETYFGGLIRQRGLTRLPGRWELYESGGSKKEAKMKKKKQTIVIPKDIAERIKRDLSPDFDLQDIRNRYDRDHTESYTADFGGGIEMDIKLCNSDFDETDTTNPLWTEAVLFQDGIELCHTDVCDTFFGLWELEDEGILYQVHVIEEP